MGRQKWSCSTLVVGQKVHLLWLRQDGPTINMTVMIYQISNMVSSLQPLGVVSMTFMMVLG
jgi:hypothetical protein